MYGVSRSPTVIAAYLMKSEQLSCAAALQSIANVKPSIKLVPHTQLLFVLLYVIRPNPGFMRQLHLWQEMKCCIDPTHKSYKSYRLGKMAKQMKGELSNCHTCILCDQACKNQPFERKLHQVIVIFSLIPSALNMVSHFCKSQKKVH